MKYINEIAKLINEDAGMRELMKVVFVQNYDCSYAEHIRPLFGRKCLNNIVSAGIFSSDRAIEQYARDIWGIE